MYNYPRMGKLTKILFIGIDAGDKDLIQAWAAAGILPTFRTLMQRSAWTDSVNPPGLFVGAVWPSFATGVSPTRHGRYCFKQIRPGTYDTPDFVPSQTKGQPFWDALSRAHRRMAIIDIPKSSLSRNVNGIQLVDWLTHDPDEGFNTWPPELAAEVKNSHGLDPVGVCDGARRTAQDFIDLKQKLLKRAQMKSDFSSTLLRLGGWDCFMTVFTEGHCIGHQCWHLWDKNHPRYDAELCLQAGNPIQEVYQAIDRNIGRLIDEAGPDSTVFVLASHGMGPHYEGTYMLDQILRKLEPKGGNGWAPKDMAKKLWHVLPRPLRARLFRDIKKKLNADANERLFFQIPNNDVHGGIRINLIGREPSGKVRPGAEYDALCKQLTRDLLALVNLKTQRPLVNKVSRITELYPGENVEALPDLVIEWNREAPIASVYSKKTGKIEGVYEGCRTGDHKSEGLFFALGPSIKAGRLGRPVSVMDFAPSIASLLDVPLPGVDGKSFLQLIK